MMWLKQDEKSGKGSKFYGKKGDKVSIVVDGSEVVIVQGAAGEKFPVRLEDLSKSIVKPDLIIIKKTKK